MAYAGQHIIVVGLGETGLSAARWLIGQGARVTVADSRASPPNLETIKVMLPQGQVVQDPLTGDSYSASALAERLQPFLDQAGITPDDAPPLGLYLQAAHPRDVVARMLRNLQEIHQVQKDWPMLVAVLNRLILLQPGREELFRDRGMAYAQWGVIERALLDLERYAPAAQGQEVDYIVKTIARLRRTG